MPQDYDRYGSDVLAGFNRRAKPAELPKVEAEFDLVVEEVASDFCGSVVSTEGRLVELEDRHGRRRTFPLGAGFLLEGRPVQLVPPRSAAARAAAAGGAPALRRTASGSIAGPEQRARVARASRIFVEGRHDAELVEKIWGDDLRGEGVVVEYLEGVDDLDAIVREFAPSRERRIGVLVDHLVTGSKESRIAEAVQHGPFGRDVLVVGHPFIDIWQAVTPAAMGIRAWPTVPRGVEWKHGICEAFGWPHADQADIARAWKRILGRARSYTDLESALLGRVEQLIDFVTEPVA
ncbi:DUF3097 domain-containing protein [Herbiconiux moechotypicola]|uniref:DUF3097 domain-containing protein n=1 Tax=Herbiconiux moechotypicola TaxID=637393 RepID=A0ABN3DBZ0_9MICO|nr:DUF3097 domain-containing protein [Herbiconiux moechotypicola]MCS5728819.1 DUF3097 domain-containing protein [Herbiconiux moechotypicola]